MTAAAGASVVGALILTATLVSCTTAEGVLPAQPATHPHVRLYCPLEPAFRYDPASLPLETVDAVYTCTTEPWTAADNGDAQIIEYVDRIAAADVPALLDAYATPDEAQEPGRACTEEYQDPRILWVHAGETIVAVRAPRDACEHPLATAVAAFDTADRNRVLVAREVVGSSTEDGQIPGEDNE